MFCLRPGKCFGERVSGHVVHRAIDESNRAVFDDISDKMILYVDVLGSCMKVSICGDGDSRLIVTVKSSWATLMQVSNPQPGGRAM